jgi:hypothetical protein
MKNEKHAGRLLTALLAGAAAFMLLAAASCDTTNSETYKDITTSVTFLDGQILLTCPENLMNESKGKINGVMAYIENDYIVDQNKTVEENAYKSLLSLYEVKIIVKDDGSVATCEQSDSTTMVISYQWLKTSSNTVIGEKIIQILGMMTIDTGIYVPG